MDSYKLKVRIGQHEFEAEGPQEAVERQFAAFKDLISGISSQQQPHLEKPSTLADQAAKLTVDRLVNGQITNAAAAVDLQVEADRLSKIFRLEGDSLSLTALPSGEGREADAALLLLYGHKVFRGAEVIGVMDLLSGLRQSGYGVERFDRLVAAYVPSLIIKSGQRIGAKFRLTNQGLAKARTIAEELLTVIA